MVAHMVAARVEVQSCTDPQQPNRRQRIGTNGMIFGERFGGVLSEHSCGCLTDVLCPILGSPIDVAHVS